MTYHRTTALGIVAWLYVVTGIVMLVAPFFAFQMAGSLAINGLVVALGLVVVAAGAGLLRGAGWAWPVASAIAVSGVIVTVARLWAGGAPDGLVPALLTNLITLVILWAARRAVAHASA